MSKDSQEQAQLSDILDLLYNIDDNQVMIFRKLQSLQDEFDVIRSLLQLSEPPEEQ